MPSTRFEWQDQKSNNTKTSTQNLQAYLPKVTIRWRQNATGKIHCNKMIFFEQINDPPQDNVYKSNRALE